MPGNRGQCDIVNIHMPNTSDNIYIYRSVLCVSRHEVPMSAEHVLFCLGDWSFTLEDEGHQNARGGLWGPGGRRHAQ
eukprot:5306491-Pyramimonas_sp.AAC.1